MSKKTTSLFIASITGWYLALYSEEHLDHTLTTSALCFFVHRVTRERPREMKNGCARASPFQHYRKLTRTPRKVTRAILRSTGVPFRLIGLLFRLTGAHFNAVQFVARARVGAKNRNCWQNQRLFRCLTLVCGQLSSRAFQKTDDGLGSNYSSISIGSY